MTNKPLPKTRKLYNDSWYTEGLKHIENKITQEEFLLYKTGKISNIYSSLDQVLIENPTLYHRIIRYLVFAKTGRLIDQSKLVIDKKKELKLDTHEMTPTRLFTIINIGDNSNLCELMLAFPGVKFKKDANFKNNFNQIMDSVAWFGDLVKFTCGKYKKSSYVAAAGLDLTEANELADVINFNDDTAYFNFQHLDIQNCFQKNLELIDWHHTISSKFDALKCRETTFSFIGDVFGRIFGPNYDYLFYVEHMKADTFLMSRKPFRGDYQEVEETINNIIPTIKRWYAHTLTIKTHLWTNIMVSLCRYFIDLYGTEFIAAKHSGDGRLKSVITLSKVGRTIKLREQTYDNQTGTRLFDRGDFYSSGHPAKIAEHLIKHTYFIYTKESEIEQLMKLVTALYLNADPVPVLDHYGKILKLKKNNTSVRSAIDTEHENNIKTLEQNMFKRLLNETKFRNT